MENERLFYIVERRVTADRNEHDTPLIGGMCVGGKLFPTYETAKQVILTDLVPSAERKEGTNHRRTEHVEITYGAYSDPQEMWKVTTKDKNGWDTVFFIKETGVAPE